MRVAYCVPYLWNSGGVDRVITVKANYLADVLGYEVILITSDQQGIPPYFPLSPKVKRVDVEINFYTYHGKTYPTVIDLCIRLWRCTWKRWLFRSRLTDVLKELNPDITISVSRRELPFLYKIKAGGVKIAERHICRNNRLNHPAPFVMRCLNRYLTRQEDCQVAKYPCAVTLTEEDKAMWHHNERMRVIPNPLTDSVAGISSLDNPCVIAVGRICAEKGYDRLVKAWSFVEKKFPNWELHIVGSQDDASQTMKLRAEIDKLRLNRIRLIPHTHAIAEIYQKASILALTSYYEGLPLVMLEAMSHGVPCVAMACQCGPRDIITDGVNGLLVNNGDVEAFAAALMRLMSDDGERKRMGTEALRRSKDFALPVIMSRWDELFHQLTEKP